MRTTLIYFSLLTLVLSSHGQIARKAGQSRTFKLQNDLSIEMVWIPSGSFTMGNTSGEDDRWSEDEQAHEVIITKGFWMSKYEITQSQWTQVMGTQPSEEKGEQLPVTNVSWQDAMDFIKKTRSEDTNYDLPTEAQWEHAAKAGTNQPYSLPRDQITWHKGNSGGSTHPVGQKQPNAWGLYDIHGNVGEWVKDWRAAFTAQKTIDPTGPETGEFKLIKGGQFTGRPRHTQSFDRQRGNPTSRRFFIGFRIIRHQ